MNIRLENIGKRFSREWIFRGINCVFENGKTYAVTGANGSGKSTLLQVIAGATMASEGKVLFDDVPAEKHFSKISYAAPYLDLIEELTGLEFLQFQKTFKPLSIPEKSVLESVQLLQAKDKQIRNYSSGMKQRLKLAQAFFSKAPVLILDEPTTNLDEEGVSLYKRLLASANKEIIIIGSNIQNEYAGADGVLHIENFKKKA